MAARPRVPSLVGMVSYGLPQPRLAAPRVSAQAWGTVAVALAAANGLSNLISLGSGLAFRAPTEAPPALLESFTTMRELLVLGGVQSAVMVVMDVVLLAAGVLLLVQRDLGRRLAVGWSCAAIAVVIGRGLLFELLAWPLTARLMAPALAIAQDGAGAAAGRFDWVLLYARINAYVTLAVLLAFPVALLVAMTRPTMKRSLRSA